MINAVINVRKLADKFAPDEIQAVLEEGFVEAAARHQEASSGPADMPPGDYSPRIITAHQLQHQAFAPVFVVPALIVEGVTLFAGKPKLGKSWLALELAVAVANGMKVLGGVEVAGGQVLGLFLEDSERRLQSRMRKLNPAPGAAWPRGLHLATEWRRFDVGGLLDIDAWCASTHNPKLVIIDTLAKLRPAQSSRKSPYDLDYEALSGLHAIAHRYQVAIVVIHHTRKAEADDVFDTVSGTLGLTGAADSILVLGRKSGSAVLYARGRDIEDSETALKLNSEQCRWIKLGSANEVFMSTTRAQIVAALEASATPLTPTDLMVATGLRNRNALDIQLLRMVRDGQITKAGRGKYAGAGKIGKKDGCELQAVEKPIETGSSSDLSANATTRC